jgi:hypothetical protein
MADAKTLVYLLYDYEEHGPENLIADVDPGRFRRRAVALLGEMRFLPEHRPQETQKVLGILDAAITAGVGREPLGGGWGAPVVQVVEIPNE